MKFKNTKNRLNGVAWLRVLAKPCLLSLVIICGCSEKAGKTVHQENPLPHGRGSFTVDTTVEIKEQDCQTVDEMDFLDCMVKKTKCSVADAVRAVGILTAGSDVGKDYDARYQYLVEHDIVRPNWNLEPDQWIDRGTLAYMLIKAANIKGGVNMLLFGSNGLGDRRYAYREMMYRELMPGGVDYNYVSGPELVTTVGKVDRYIQERQKDSPEKETQLGESAQHKIP
ncbi:MAG: hypothetical protein WC975_09380 [Phycisphaerae bacterium]